MPKKKGVELAEINNISMPPWMWRAIESKGAEVGINNRSAALRFLLYPILKDDGVENSKEGESK